MSEPLVTSRLWKFVQLVNHSVYFPLLVEGAALIENKPMSEGLLRYVGAQSAVLDAINLVVGGSVDPEIEQLIVTAGTDVDTVIRNAVVSYQSI